MGRILAIDGSEICKMLSFARSDDAATAQVSVEDEVKLTAIEGDVLFEDAAGNQFRGAVQRTNVYGSGASASAVVHALLRDG